MKREQGTCPKACRSRAHDARIRRDPDLRCAELPGQAAPQLRRPPARAARRAAQRARRSSTPASCPISCPRHAAIREADWKVAPVPADLQDRRVEITGPTDRKMVINALNSGANMFMADFEDSSTPTWDNQIQGQINMRDAVRGTIAFTSPEGKQLQAQRQDRDAAGAPARLASDREASAGRRAADVGLAVRFRPVLLPQRQGATGQGVGHLFLPAQDGVAPRGAPVERRVRARAERARRAAGHGQGHRADRDDPGRVRDGRDPVRAARAFGRAQLRPLGLHLQLHQEIP